MIRALSMSLVIFAICHSSLDPLTPLSRGHYAAYEVTRSCICESDRTLKSGGTLSIGNLYSQNLHNRKIASLRYKLNLHRNPDREQSMEYIRRSTRIYTILANTGLYRLHRKFKFPYVLHYNNIPGKYFDYYYSCALDYYMCLHRYLTTSEEVKFWSERLGVLFNETPKGYKIIK